MSEIFPDYSTVGKHAGILIRDKERGLFLAVAGKPWSQPFERSVFLLFFRAKLKVKALSRV